MRIGWKYLAAIALVTALTASTAAYAAMTVVYPKAQVVCVEVKTKWRKGYSNSWKDKGYTVGCGKRSQTGYIVYINKRSVAVVDSANGKVVFDADHK
jgi:hypothetical protein